MDFNSEVPGSPGAPLFPISPGKMNRQPISQSPSLPSGVFRLQDSYAHGSRSSDVQGKVAQFNNLSKEGAQKRKDNDAALKRAVLGREEAESETKRMKEELIKLQQELAHSNDREIKVGQRLESMMEDMHRMQEEKKHAKSVYEKEVRRARKEAFKSSSALVQIQEELRTTKNRYTLMREEVDEHKRRLEARDQELFADQYKLSATQEELETFRHRLKMTQDEKHTSETCLYDEIRTLKQQVRSIESERDALKGSLKGEEVARIAAEGKISLPRAEETDEFATPKKLNQECMVAASKECDKPMSHLEHTCDTSDVDELREKLQDERLRLKKVEQQISFMQMECQFRNCSCRIAERQGLNFAYDNSLDAQVEQILKSWRTVGSERPNIRNHRRSRTAEPVGSGSMVIAPEALIEFSPSTGTFKKLETPSAPTTDSQSHQLAVRPSSSQILMNPARELSDSPSLLNLDNAVSLDGHPTLSSAKYRLEVHNTVSPDADITPKALPDVFQNYAVLEPEDLASSTQTTIPLLPAAAPSTPRPLPQPPTRPQTVHGMVDRNRFVTTTTTVPIADSFSPSKTQYPYSPAATMTRDEALEAIRRRRGRARSVHASGTPRRPLSGGQNRRDISASTVA